MRKGLEAALRAGQRILLEGGDAVAAAAAAVCELESAEDFNAGRGSVLTSAGKVEMDASIMRGSDRAAGAVACVRRTVHPIQAAWRLLEQGKHVLLVGSAADAHAAAQGLAMQESSWFITPDRRQALERILEQAREPSLDHDEPELGTVGAVARDVKGHLAAATSTGGLTGQSPGRVGDSPIPGAGTWADDRSCAVSATGEGEQILRAAFGHQVAAWIEIGGLPLEQACHRALAGIEASGGRAGCIAIDRFGRIATPFTTEGMARGMVRRGDEPRTALFGDETLQLS